MKERKEENRGQNKEKKRTTNEWEQDKNNKHELQSSSVTIRLK